MGGQHKFGAWSGGIGEGRWHKILFKSCEWQILTLRFSAAAFRTAFPVAELPVNATCRDKGERKVRTSFCSSISDSTSIGSNSIISLSLSATLVSHG